MLDMMFKDKSKSPNTDTNTIIAINANAINNDNDNINTITNSITNTDSIDKDIDKGKGINKNSWYEPFIPAVLATLGVGCLELGGSSMPGVGDLWACVQPVMFGLGFWRAEK